METTNGIVKVVCLGDPQVGKTCCIHKYPLSYYSYLHNQFIEEYSPTAFETNTLNVKTSRKLIKLNV